MDIEYWIDILKENETDLDDFVRDMGNGDDVKIDVWKYGDVAYCIGISRDEIVQFVVSKLKRNIEFSKQKIYEIESNNKND